MIYSISRDFEILFEENIRPNKVGKGDFFTFLGNIASKKSIFYKLNLSWIVLIYLKQFILNFFKK